MGFAGSEFHPVETTRAFVFLRMDVHLDCLRFQSHQPTMKSPSDELSPSPLHCKIRDCLPFGEDDVWGKGCCVSEAECHASAEGRVACPS
jgi:hypothetical protein